MAFHTPEFTQECVNTLSIYFDVIDISWKNDETDSLQLNGKYILFLPDGDEYDYFLLLPLNKECEADYENEKQFKTLEETIKHLLP